MFAVVTYSILRASQIVIRGDPIGGVPDVIRLHRNHLTGDRESGSSIFQIDLSIVCPLRVNIVILDTNAKHLGGQ